jgi:putative addiction module component (TIGR02574 family)
MGAEDGRTPTVLPLALALGRLAAPPNSGLKQTRLSLTLDPRSLALIRWADGGNVMGLKKIRSEGGSGGRRGHSNMTHWAYTHEVKVAARAQRRADDKRSVREADVASLNQDPVQVACGPARFLGSATLDAMSEPSQVLQAALELAPRERAELVEAIAASLDGFDLGDEWEEEIQKRVRDVDSGQVTAVPGEEVFSRIEQRLRDR